MPLDGPRYAEPGRWIPTSADMPDYGIAVIVATSEGEVGEAHRYDEHWRWANEVDIGDHVTHWQDLPEAPAVANVEPPKIENPAPERWNYETGEWEIR